MHAHSDATLALVGEDADTATFQAMFVGHKNVNRYNLWVQLDAFDAAHTDLGRAEQAIQAWVGDIATLTIPKPVVEGFDHYEAYVWLFPDNTTPVSNTVSFS